jgi:hypothetical protein
MDEVINSVLDVFEHVREEKKALIYRSKLPNSKSPAF